MADERPFIKVSDTFADHPKFIALDDDAAGFMVVAMWGYCRHQNTDGLIPKAKAHRLTKSASAARCLKAIKVGLLEDAGDSYRCHDYLDHQQSAAQRQSKSEQAKQAGRAGGLAKRKRTAKQTATETLSDTASGIEAEVEVEVEVEESPSDSRSRDALLDRFADFWAVYPRRVDRGHAVKAWKAAVKKDEPDTIIAAAVSFAEASRGTEPKFIAHPATWLNGERWLDAPVTQLHAGEPRDPRQTRLRGVRL
jgi:hypothetical protein